MTDQQNAWVTRVLGVQLEAEPDNRAARLKTIGEDVRAQGLQDTLGAALRAAATAVDSSRPGADALLDDLERQITQAAADARMKDVQATVQAATNGARTSIVALSKARIELGKARSAHQTARQALVDACEQARLSMVGDGIAEDPDTIAQVAAIGDRLPDIDAMSDEVEDALDAMISSADPAQRDSARQKALGAIRSFRDLVDGDPILTGMENSPAGNFPIRASLAGALDSLETALAA